MVAENKTDLTVNNKEVDGIAAYSPASYTKLQV
jgi:hypothetical protein